MDEKGLRTEMVDVLDIPINNLSSLSDEELKHAFELVLRQVSKPRANLGSSGPPGRVD